MLLTYTADEVNVGGATSVVATGADLTHGGSLFWGSRAQGACVSLLDDGLVNTSFQKASQSMKIQF